MDDHWLGPYEVLLKANHLFEAHLLQVLTRLKLSTLIRNELTKISGGKTARDVAVPALLLLNLEAVYLRVEDNFLAHLLRKIEAHGRLFGLWDVLQVHLITCGNVFHIRGHAGVVIGVSV